jgi:hypothetical protein
MSRLDTFTPTTTTTLGGEGKAVQGTHPVGQRNLPISSSNACRSLAALDARFEAGAVTDAEWEFIERLLRSKWWRLMLSPAVRLTDVPRDIEKRNRIDETGPLLNANVKASPVRERVNVLPARDHNGTYVRPMDPEVLEPQRHADNAEDDEAHDHERSFAGDLLVLRSTPRLADGRPQYRCHPLLTGYRMPMAMARGLIDVDLWPAYYRNISRYGVPREADLAPIIEWLGRGGWRIEEARSIATRRGRPPKDNHKRHWLGVRLAELSIRARHGPTLSECYTASETSWSRWLAMRSRGRRTTTSRRSRGICSSWISRFRIRPPRVLMDDDHLNKCGSKFGA